MTWKTYVFFAIFLVLLGSFIFLGIAKHKEPDTKEAINPLNPGAVCDGHHDDLEGFVEAMAIATGIGAAVSVPDNCMLGNLPGGE